MIRIPCLLAGLIALPLFAAAAQAQYPQRTIKMVVPLQAGAVADVVARKTTSELGKKLGADFVIENHKGSNAAIMAGESIQNAPGDGYTLLASSTVVIATEPARAKKDGQTLPYDPRQFVSLCGIASYPGVFVVPRLSNAHPSKTMSEFIAWAREKSAGPNARGVDALFGNSIQEVLLRRFARLAGIKMVGIPFKGASGTNAVMSELLAGRGDFTIVAASNLSGYLADGSLRALALDSDERSAFFPGVPTLGEFMPWLSSDASVGIMGPPTLLPEPKERLLAALEDVKREGALNEFLKARSLTPLGSSCAEYKTHTERVRKNWDQILSE